MSGFQRSKGTYQLTGKKAEHWHRDCHCGAKSFDDIVSTHLRPAGFSVVGRYGEISGPGLSEGSTTALYLAVSAGKRGAWRQVPPWTPA